MKLNKSVAAVLTLASSTLFAGTMGPTCTPGSVSVPCDQNGWEFGAQALYLKPTYLGNLYAGNYTDAANNTNYQKLNPDWSWGFRLDVAYHFGTGNDVSLNWSHLNKTSYFNVLQGSAAASTNLTMEIKPKWDAVNAELGQHVDYGEHKNIRFHGGLQFARISDDWYYTIPSTPFTESYLMKFNGLGPRVGADLSYDWSNGFALYAKGASALLVGDSSFSTATLGLISTAGRSSGSQMVVVPELEAKVGATYSYPMAQGRLSLDAGYMWQNYFNVLSVTSTAAGPGLNFTSPFGISGPYFGLKYIGFI